MLKNPQDNPFMAELAAGHHSIAVALSDRESVVTNIASAEADVLEFRIDSFRITGIAAVEETIELVRSESGNNSQPLIGTFRSACEGGGRAVERDETRRTDYLLSMLPLFDALDVEIGPETGTGSKTLETVAEEASNQGKAIIGSYHNFDELPKYGALKALVDRGQASGADVVKLAVHLSSAEDVLQIRSFANQHSDENSLIIATMGKTYGTAVRLEMPSCGSLLSYAKIDNSQLAVSGQMDLHSMREALNR